MLVCMYAVITKMDDWEKTAIGMSLRHSSLDISQGERGTILANNVCYWGYSFLEDSSLGTLKGQRSCPVL